MIAGLLDAIEPKPPEEGASMTALRTYLGDVGIPATSAEALRNQAAHWAGACAFDKDAVGREHCSCGNCGGYRLFLAALAHAYASGYADMCVESAIADQAKDDREKPASVTAMRWAELLRAEADASWFGAALDGLMQFRDPSFLSDAAERLRPKWEARMRANGEWLKRAEHKIGEAEMFSERESQ